MNSLRCRFQFIPSEARAKLRRYISSNRKRPRARACDGKTSLIPVFSRFSFHLERTGVPHFSSAIVLSSAYSETHVGRVCPAVVFIEMGKGIKVT